LPLRAEPGGRFQRPHASPKPQNPYYSTM
jgi:hypothetical protein